MPRKSPNPCCLLALTLVCLCLAGPGCAFAQPSAGLPEKAPQDAIMASPAEIAEIHRWAAAALGSPQADQKPGAVNVKLVRQDFSTLHMGESCMDTPITIGSRKFEHGLGTHANSNIEVTLPPGAKAFEAFVGIDNNYDTRGQYGSAQFAVAIAGKEVYRSDTLKGGGEPVAVRVPIPADAKSLTLIVETTADGPGYDQSDWADARLLMADGSTRYLDENRTTGLLLGTELPFSFTYDGKPSTQFLKDWKRSPSVSDQQECVIYRTSWTDPQTGLVVEAVATVFKDYPAVDWLLTFENRGSADTPIIENIRTADLQLNTSNTKRELVLHQLRGDNCSEKSFAPFDTRVMPGRSANFAPARGRPSQETAFPFWNIEYSDRGVITAIGWSGQWSAGYERTPAGPTRFHAGLERTHLLLHPGEKIRSPRVLMMTWRGDRTAAHNRFRRLMLFQYVPKLNGRPMPLPTALQTFDRYIRTPDWPTEAGQLKAVEAAQKLGCNTYWFDAGWFVGGFPNGVGNWYCKPQEFPNGLRPIGDSCRQKGIQFIVWFEPCRVAPGTQIAREHPEFVLGGDKGGLYNLGDPAARKWITDLVSKRIDEFGLAAYREDYNIDPLDYWRNNDKPDRQGMTEIRFVEGHYQFWDDLRSRHPGLWIDNCSSGGRRIDLETCIRAVPLWRSDTSCWFSAPEWNQQQSMALSQYIPLHTAAAWQPETYVVRSAATGGLICELDYQDPAFPLAKAAALIDEAKTNQKYWYGDFYPLTPCGIDPGQFTAWQFHRADLNEGIVLAFRRPECEWMGVIFSPRGLDPKTAYRCEFTDENGKKTTRTFAAGELQQQGLDLRIAARGQSLLVRYAPAGK